MKPPPIHIVSNAEAEDADFVACIRVADATLIAADSTQQDCAGCGQKIWVAPSSPKRPAKLCVHCAVGMIGTKQ